MNTDMLPSIRIALLVVGFLAMGLVASAGNVRVELDASGYKGERALLYRYMDLFTLRTELIGQATIDAQGKAVLEGAVSGTVKGTIRIGGNSCDLWLRSGTYSVGFPLPAAGTARSLNGTTEVIPTFKELDRLEAEKKKLCGGYAVSSCNPKKVDTSKIRCSAILRAIPQRQACLAARQLVQDRCFGGKPDAGHRTQMDDVENGIRQCEALKLINCAKGHSMAGL